MLAHLLVNASGHKGLGGKREAFTIIHTGVVPNSFEPITELRSPTWIEHTQPLAKT